MIPEDVNGDGKVDVILYNNSTGTEYTGISNGNGTFSYTYGNWGIGKVLALDTEYGFTPPPSAILNLSTATLLHGINRTRLAVRRQFVTFANRQASAGRLHRVSHTFP